ncbi:MAG: peptidoglycan-binding protein [Marivivens sp.]|nr:peptidoglycan-binding protein [Marivivens sp.]
MHFKTATICILALTLGSACSAPLPGLDALLPPETTETTIAEGSDGTCQARSITPAIIETVTEQIIVQPAELSATGEVLEPATFRTVTRQAIVQERREVLFDAVCPRDLTADFVSALQRALIVRGFHAGGVTGEYDRLTRAAVQSFQRRTDGPDTSTLSLASAQRLGLVAIPRSEL